MKRTSFADTNCPIARSLDVMGEWWTLLILRDVFCGIRRFDQLLTNLSISRNVLTDRLRTLVESGILERKMYQEKPERFEYYLTERGSELIPVLSILMNWGNRWLMTEPGETVQMIHETCGQSVTPQLVCNHCEEEITLQNVRPDNLGDKLKIHPKSSKKTKSPSPKLTSR
jgi:DNA-binding HxlR family transcriptional regulator